MPVGSDPHAEPLPTPGDGPGAALDRVILGALARSPCVVSFSGGRDSSAILAVAARAARREGLDPPLPVTVRFPGVPDSDEVVWQELVIRHLGLEEWVRLEFGGDLDLVGPVAAAVLRRHGLIWPPNTHFHQPILELAKGGSILTGIDGDGALGSWRWTRVMGVLTGRLRPELRDTARVLLSLAPRRVRGALDRRYRQTPLPWLRPAAMAEVARAWSVDRATEPVRWDRRVQWYARRRSLRMLLHDFRLLADDVDVLAVHPFADPAFLSALADAGAGAGLGDRTAIMRALFAHVLPDPVLSRQGKARLDNPFWNRHSRQFAANWEGHGVDTDLVDPDALREEWSKPVPHGFSSTLIQAAWLAEDTA